MGLGILCFFACAILICVVLFVFWGKVKCREVHCFRQPAYAKASGKGEHFPDIVYGQPSGRVGYY